MIKKSNIRCLVTMSKDFNSKLKEIANKLSLDESFKKKLDELISAVEG